jgi:hypothetical protein
VPAAQTPPVASAADVLAVLPAFVRRSDSAPVRDAIAAALAEILLRYQELVQGSANQCDLAYATGLYLESLCEDRGIYKQPNESEDGLRARALTTPDLVTPTAILAAANTILAGYTSVKATYAESILDRWFVQKGGARWHSFVGANPRYLSRLYPDDAAVNGGAVRPGSQVGGARLFSDQVGRHFLLRVPILTSLTAAHAFVARGRDGAFLGTGGPSAAPSERQGARPAWPRSTCCPR